MTEEGSLRSTHSHTRTVQENKKGENKDGSIPGLQNTIVFDALPISSIRGRLRALWDGGPSTFAYAFRNFRQERRFEFVVYVLCC